MLSFGVGEKEAGVIISLANGVNTFAGLCTIFFSHHLGLFNTLGIIILLNSIGFLTNAFSSSLYLTGFCFIIATAGFGVFHNVAFSYITATSERQSLGKAMGDFTAIGDIGRIPLASLAGFLAAISIFEIPGWRVVCFAYGIGALLFAGYIWRSFRSEIPGLVADNPPAATPKKVFPSFSILRRRQYLLPISASVLDAFGGNQIFVFLPFLLFAKGIDLKVIGGFALAFTIGCFIGKTLLGRLVDKFGARKVFLISEFILAILLVILIFGDNIFVVVGVSLLLGAVTKGTVPVIQTIIVEPSGNKDEHVGIFSINTFSRGIANMISPLVFGFIASAIGINWAFVIMAIISVCAIIPVLLMRFEHNPI